MDIYKSVLLELQEYERDILSPLATESIAINLDDGVLENYNMLGKPSKNWPYLMKKLPRR